MSRKLWRRIRVNMRGNIGAAARRLSALGAIAACALTFSSIAAGADRIYWSNLYGNTISYANLDGTGGGDLKTGAATLGGPQGIAIDSAAGRIYWANASGSISFANLNGSGGGNLNTGTATLNDPTGVTLDPGDGRIYWANWDGGGGFGAVSFARLDNGGGANLSISGANNHELTGMTIDRSAGRIYWANNVNPAVIGSARFDGTGFNALGGATVAAPVGLAIDPVAGGRMYWADFYDNKISFANLNGTGGGGDVTTTGATVSSPFGLAIDPIARRIYWASYAGGSSTASRISWAKLDGSSAKDLDTGAATVYGANFVALLRTPGVVRAPTISGGSSAGSVLSCSHGGWAGDLLGSFLYRAPRSFAYRWIRDGAVIPRATASSYTATAGGSYRCRVSAANAAGATPQTSPAHAVKPPKPKITKVKLDRVKQSARFSFRANGAGGFQCALLKPKKPKPTFAACRSPKGYKHLKPGSYTFEVRALSRVGHGPAVTRGFTI